MIPISGTHQRMSYDAGRLAALTGKPNVNPQSKRSDTKSAVLASWWNAGYQSIMKLKKDK